MQNFKRKVLTEVKIFQNVFFGGGGYFFETPCIQNTSLNAINNKGSKKSIKHKNHTAFGIHNLNNTAAHTDVVLLFTRNGITTNLTVLHARQIPKTPHKNINRDIFPQVTRSVAT